MAKKMIKKINKVYRITKSRIVYYYAKTFIGFGMATNADVEAFENMSFEEEA